MTTGKVLNILTICLTVATAVVTSLNQDKKIEEYIDQKLMERE